MKYQDIQIPDLALTQEHKEQWNNNNYQQSFDVLDSNPQLNSKKFVANISIKNKVKLEDIQNTYKRNFPDFLLNLLNQYDVSIEDFVDKNQWTSSTTYKVGNSVVFGDTVFFCIKENTNIQPIEGIYWRQLNLYGKQGEAGIKGRIKYDWDNLINYNIGDIVYKDEKLWYSLKENLDKDPVLSPTFWITFLAIPRTIIYVDKNAPVNTYDDLVWIKILD